MTDLAIPDVPLEIATRITSAADQLYDENGKTAFPNVDNVRRRARVNMNDASTVMRVWRREKTAAATPPPTPVPEVVQSASQALLGAVWTAATESANRGLQMAEAGWEQERAEAENCRAQLASAFDAQTEELVQCQRRASALETQLADQEAQLQGKCARIEELVTRALTAEGKAAAADARSQEIARRADDLKSELFRAHSHLDQQRQEATHRLAQAESTIDTLREDLRRMAAREGALRDELARTGAQAGTTGNASQAPAPPPHTPAAPVKRGAAGKPKSPNGA